jgi:hypothetical protein
MMPSLKWTDQQLEAIKRKNCNLLVAAGACALAAFDDEVINEVLGLNGEDSFVIYVAPVGKKW